MRVYICMAVFALVLGLCARSLIALILYSVWCVLGPPGILLLLPVPTAKLLKAVCSFLVAPGLPPLQLVRFQAKGGGSRLFSMW